MAPEQGRAHIDRKRLRSPRLREVNFQGDALRLGMISGNESPSRHS